MSQLSQVCKIVLTDVSDVPVVSDYSDVIVIFIVIVIVIVRYITPLTIGPSVAMIGLSLFDVAALNASKHWGVAIGSVEDRL